MAKESLVNELQNLFHRLAKDKGVVIDRAALVPAYEGAVAGLYILTVSMPDGQVCSDKIQCLIYGLHEYVSQAQRESLAGVQVFDSSDEFEHFMQYGRGFEHCEPCMEYMPKQRPETKPERIEVFA